MAEEINIDTIMSQAQVFASAWSLIGGAFDGGQAIENAEEAKAELRAMLEDFCSSVDLQRVAKLLVAWHQRGMDNINRVLKAPPTSEVHLDSVVLTGAQLRGFRIGLIMAQQWLGDLPLSLAASEPGEED
ncbi:TPA: host nuclease inhibitor protein [Pseudomonas aeruginosa]|uniref:host nuclease inhibitor protein n=1 Tax=Pseudomonas aeruginosa TaxID=287 RepID=UPI002953C71B|nr:host nuclease inhibitor protein [Pseudomonas aeruginosa]EKY1378574.1 host nuclease inhibitor protein [Pseudomonas aeruginosa]EKY1397480.1 host nuclease inhibitor protein [Pseudomonas aeruginosa]MDV8137892.1 host nuclease inhibitor protein [Pseudomonas aeruginosa]